MDNLIAVPSDLTPFLQPVSDIRLKTAPIQADTLRLDQLHPIVSGNKWFKLKYHLSRAKELGSKSLLTFGGAWSNHIAATAFAAAAQKIPSIGIIRGERPEQLSATLTNAAACGMQLEFVSRQQYADKDNAAFLQQLYQRFPGAYIVPEGGSGPEGIMGTGEILRQFPSTAYTHILCAIGTGATFLGLANASLPHQQLIGIPVLKGLTSPDALTTGIPPLSPEVRSRCSILTDYHFGGYARHPDKLLTFMNDLYQHTGIPTDIVYTSKLFFAFYDLVQRHYFPTHSHVLLIHSGGLQGNQSLPPGTLIF